MTDFAQRLLEWHEAAGRDLPWRGERDPYRIWVSEVMLQQTRTQTVGAYYRAFLDQFPTVRALADADEQDVLKAWEGLGYYSRARNLHAAAREVAKRPGGSLPADEDALRGLPGVGEYTAAAVASIAFGLPALAIDGNAKRVLARALGVRIDVNSAAGRRMIRSGGAALLPPDRPGDFNQALMGLGNMVCTPAAPNCAACPVAPLCDACAAGDAAALPVIAAKKPRRVERRAVALAFSGGGVLVRRRPAKGLLAGLWEFPNCAGGADELIAELAGMGVSARLEGRLPDVRHIFTHLEWHMAGYAFGCGAPPPNLRFVDGRGLAELALPTALAAYRAIAARRLGGEGV
ncbi:MAG: A/G-specific adenine glycosylase [Clostridiales bacterium]|nr:A/G-specific adenine glycosylase [Clostridiales bacterium]